MTTTMMGQIPTCVYAMISGSGITNPDPKITDSTGSFLPLMITQDGRLKTDTQLILSGTSLIVELTHATDSVAMWGSDGTHRIIKTDSTGGIELGTISLAALEGITAVISGTINANVINSGGTSAVNIQDGGNSITVDGTVNLGSSTLSALETITAVVSGTVIVGNSIELGSTTLTALENVVTVMSGTMIVDSILNDVSIKSKKVNTGAYNQVSVGTSATSIVSSNLNRNFVDIINNNVEPVYLGLDALVTQVNGYKVTSDKSWSTDKYTGGIWGIVTSGTTVVSYIEC